jgi:hypothetical protein
MKKVIRNNVFETNSSSTHAISIVNENILLPKNYTIHFKANEFYGEEILNTVEQKASFIYSALLEQKNEQNDLIMIKKILSDHGINCIFEHPIEYCGIHDLDLEEFRKFIFKDNNLINLLFSDENIIIHDIDRDFFCTHNWVYETKYKNLITFGE